MPELSADEVEWTTHHFDPRDESRLKSPYDLYAAMRTRCPVAHSDAHEDGFWVLSRHDDIKSAYLDPERFSSGPSISIPALGARFPLYPVDANGEVHSRFRRIVAAPLTVGSISNAGYEQIARKMAAERLDAVFDKGRADLVAELAFPVPARVMFAPGLLGEPPEVGTEFLDRLRDLILVLKYDPRRSADAGAELERLAAEVISAREKVEADDIPSALVREMRADNPISRDEAEGVIFLLFFGGIETPANQLGLLLMHLIRDPDWIGRLAEEPGRIPNFVEEVHRYYGQSQGMRRTLTADTEVRGVRMRKGDPVWLLVASANRDPEAFPSPDELDYDRNPNPHLGYGLGIHRCVGVQLARLLQRVVVEEFVRRRPNIRMAGTIGDVRWSLGTGRSLQSLDVIID